MKLWQKDTAVSKEVEFFTVGNDKQWDMLLAEYDVLGSLAHAQMLASVGLLSSADFADIKRELKNIYTEIKSGAFEIAPNVEDIHSQVELILTQRIGEAGKRIHCARSRNDQVLLDIKLYTRAQIQTVAENVSTLFQKLQHLSEKHKSDLLPGYTHLQLAMPSSFGLWFGAYAESLVDDVQVLLAAYKLTNKNPLGSAAGYGSSFNINRQLTTELLGFDTMHYNVVYAQMSRGKTEKVVAAALSNIAATLSKLAMDVCLYMSQGLDFISFPATLTTGSSIMPHKKNPDVFELIRGKCNRLQALPNEIVLLINNLPSGYHRDLQLTKDCLFPAFAELNACLNMTSYMLEHIQMKQEILKNEGYELLYTVEAVNEEVLQGKPFREAYQIIGKQVEENRFQWNKELHHTHEGSMGNLCNEQIKEQMESLLQQFSFDKLKTTISQLLAEQAL